MSVTFRVYGTPASQGSKRWLPNGRMIEADKKIRPWRDSVHAAIEKAGYTGPNLEGPLEVRVTFWFARPKSHFGTGKNATVLKDSAPLYVAKTPDVDKCVRALLDPITEMRVWGDDSQVVLLHAQKIYDTVPGASVEIGRALH